MCYRIYSRFTSGPYLDDPVSSLSWQLVVTKSWILQEIINLAAASRCLLQQHPSLVVIRRKYWSKSMTLHEYHDAVSRRIGCNIKPIILLVG
jgi:hypothetical protein